MQKTLHFAIIGAGTAGLAAAILLARQNIQVSIFEKAKKLEPVGAGLLLQPSGLAVFEHLGVLENALRLGAHVTGLEGKLADGSLLVNSHYAQADANYYGLGIHRATLCHVLEKGLEPYQNMVSWFMNHDVEQINEQNHEIRIIGKSEQIPFETRVDAVIIANGARSHLRPESWVKINKPYPWGAAWKIVPECLDINPQILHQFYDRAQIMMGIMPTGAIPDAPEKRLSSVFWSLPTEKLNQFLPNQHAKQQWINEVSDRWEIEAKWLENVLGQSEHAEPWLSAQYRDVVMSKFGENRIGVIGDAAHALSPQLGQGANMALLDAWALGQAIEHAKQNENIDFQKLWQKYHEIRYSSTQFYQFLSRLLTPLYQSHHAWAGPLRDLWFGFMYKIPYFRKEMAITISGLKTGMFTQLDYEKIARKSTNNDL